MAKKIFTSAELGLSAPADTGRRVFSTAELGLSGAEKQLAAMSLGKPSRMPTAAPGWPSTRQAVEAWKQPASANPVVRAIQAPARGAMVLAGAVGDVASAPYRAMAPMWGGSPDDPEAHPLQALEPLIQKIPNYQAREKLLMANEAAKFFTDPADLLQAGAGLKLGKAAASKLGKADDVLAAQKAVARYGKQTARELGPKSGAQVALEAMKKPLQSDAGSIEIPDLDDLAKKIDDAPPKAPKQPKGGLRVYKVGKSERNLFQSPEAATVKPYNEVLKDAQQAKDFEFQGVLTPLDNAAANKAVPALKQIETMRSEVGKIKGDLIDQADDYLISTNQFVDATKVKQKFQKLLADRFGGQLTKSGTVTDAAGQIIRDSSDKVTVQKFNRLLNKLGPESTLKEIDGAISDLRNIVQHKKVSQVKQMNTIAEGIGKDLRGELIKLRDGYIKNSVDWGGASGFLGENGSETLSKALRDYENIKKIETRLNSALGEVVDPVTNQPRMGASLLKSSVMSNSDRGSKALFRAVKDLTGYDLQREAANAIIAMNAVGDTRATDLLKEMGVVSSLARGDKVGAAMKLGGKGVDMFLGDKAKQTLRYYNRAKKKWSTYQDLQQEFVRQKGKGKQRGLLDPLKNERGAVGLNPFQEQQVKSPQFKNWFGDWEKAPQQASKVVDERGNPLVVSHGTVAGENFNRFNVKMSNDIKGAHFGDIDAGNHFAKEVDGSRVYPVYLDIKNPFEMEDYFLNPNRDYFDLAKDLRYKLKTLYDNPQKAANFQHAAKKAQLAAEKASVDRAGVPAEVKSFFNKLKKELQENGYDGIKYDNEFEGTGESWAVFSPTQIKSATGNSGAFSPTNPDIRGFSAPAIMAGTGAAAAGGLTAGAILQKKFEEAKKRKKGR